MDTLFVWGESFPKGYGHTSISFLKRCPGFNEAKKGDMSAAQSVVHRCAKQDRLYALREQYPDVMLIPVLGQNCLPLALAQIIDMPIWHDVLHVHIVSRKAMSAFQRLLHTPSFTGVIRKDMDYILVDDVVTQGGTIAALRKFVIQKGGRVVAVVALAYAIGSHTIAPQKQYLVRLMVKFGVRMEFFLRKIGIATAIGELTNMQAKYLLRFASMHNIEKRLESFRATCFKGKGVSA